MPNLINIENLTQLLDAITGSEDGNPNISVNDTGDGDAGCRYDIVAVEHKPSRTQT